jgi:nucleoid-associated protein YgaU
MTVSPLGAPSTYPRTSRYSGIDTAVYVQPDGTEVPYLRRRLLPPPQRLTDLTEHVVSAGDRPDLLAFRYLGDAEQWWRIADANPVLDPDDLTATPGRRLRITLPDGVPGGTGG